MVGDIIHGKDELSVSFGVDFLKGDRHNLFFDGYQLRKIFAVLIDWVSEMIELQVNFLHFDFKNVT